MAENQDGQEKTEDATSRRRGEARDRGNLPRSRDLNVFLTMVGASIGLFVFGGSIIDGMLQVLSSNLTVSRAHIFDSSMMPTLFLTSVIAMLKVVLPFMLLLAVIALLTPAFMGGYMFSAKPLAFKFSKMNPIAGLKRIFSLHGVMELLKSLMKVALVAPVGIWLFMHDMDSFLGLGAEPVKQAFAHAGDLLLWSFLILSSVLIVLALVDAPFQAWRYNENLKMTKQEVKDERKNMDGDPQVRGRIRSKQREIAMRRMMAQVPKADVVVTNPTHFAVAIKYDGESGGAPIVVAKGVDVIAMQIRNMANEYSVPIMRAPLLARALYYSTELDREIPQELYLATAQVLAYIFKLRERNPGRPLRPEPMYDLPIPKKYKRYEE